MRHRPLTTLESFLPPRCNAQRQGKRKPRSLSCPGRHNVLLIFPSHRHRRHLRSLSSNSNLSFNPPSPPLVVSSDCTIKGPTTSSEASFGRCGALPHFVQLFRPCVRRARTLDRVNHPRGRSSRPDTLFFSTVPAFLFSSFFGICPASTGLSWGDAIRSGHRPNTRRKAVSELNAESRHQNGHSARCRAIRLASRERRWIPAVSAIRGPGAAERHFFANDRHRNRRRRRQRWAEGCQLREEAERLLSFRRGIASRDGADRRIVPGPSAITPRALPKARELDRQY
jgi:hypothetical protein